MKKSNTTRRKFLGTTAIASGALLSLPLNGSAQMTDQTSTEEINIIGPKKGFTPHIGTMVSMMNWMRDTILYPVRNMKMKDLDHLHDKNSNSIGAMLFHLAATERFYQLNTFDGRDWGDWPKEDSEMYSVAMGLGDEGRKTIKGHKIEFYLDLLKKVRNQTLEEFARRDDDWLMAVDKNWGWGPTNNYCKWFHVCEHESNHNGQIKYLKSRLPG